MTTVFICERCGTRWGWFVRRNDPRHALMELCSKGECDVLKMHLIGMLYNLQRKLVVV